MHVGPTDSHSCFQAATSYASVGPLGWSEKLFSRFVVRVVGLESTRGQCYCGGVVQEVAVVSLGFPC